MPAELTRQGLEGGTKLMRATVVHWFVATPGVRAALLCTALLVAPVAFAGKNVLYKCVGPAGVISIQSVACPAGSTQAWRRDATPEPAPTPEQTAQAEAKLLRDQQTVREQLEIVDRKLQQPAPTPTPETTAAASTAPVADDPAKKAVEVSACDEAQAFAGAVREKEWLALSEEQIRHLYSWVAERCKGSPKSN
jgi:hypothetical protein